MNTRVWQILNRLIAYFSYFQYLAFKTLARKKEKGTGKKVFESTKKAAIRLSNPILFAFGLIYRK